MRRHQVVVFAAAAAALLVTGCAQAAADRAQPVLRHEPAGAAGSWGRAITVPGLGALNTGGKAEVSSVSCASAGNCAAGGGYDGGGSGAWVVREKNGVWAKRTAVPGLGALNKGSVLGVSSVSCASAGSCVAGGFYQEAGRYALQGFVT